MSPSCDGLFSEELGKNIEQNDDVGENNDENLDLEDIITAEEVNTIGR